MRFPFVLRSRYDDLNADCERLRRERDQFKDDRDAQRAVARASTRQLALEDAANRRLHDRNLELGRRVSALSESAPDYAAALERRVARLQKAGKRVLAAWAVERRRAAHLQERLDDAVGLAPRGIKDSAAWQPAWRRPKADES